MNGDSLAAVRRSIARQLPSLATPWWRWWFPALILVALFSGVATFLWFSRRVETSQHRRQQIADTLWMEQTIRRNLQRHEEALDMLGKEIAVVEAGAETFNSRVELLRRNSPEIRSIAWYGANGGRIAAKPGDAALPQDRLAEIFARLKFQRDPGYSRPYGAWGAQRGKSDYAIDLVIPVGGGASPGGVLVASIDLGSLLTEMVPWWFAQTNEVQLLNAEETVLAKRAAGGAGRGVYVDTINLDLPGAPLFLRTDSVSGAPPMVPNVLVGTVALLSLILAWCLWILFLRRSVAEQQLREQHGFRKAMEDSLVTGLRARDRQGRVTYVNPAFCRIVGFSAEELLGRTPPMPYWLPEAIEDHERSFRRSMAGDAPPQGNETILQHRDGHRIQVVVYEAPLIDADGHQTGWMSSIVDVTERRRIEEINRQQQEKLQAGARLATMGELTSTLSHEINQPLSAIMSYATGCLNLIERGRLKGDAVSPELADAIRKIQTQAQRTGMIIRSVHDLVKKREPRLAPCDLDELVKSVLPLMEMQAKKAGVVVRTQVPERPIYVTADYVMLEQVLVNLARNAIDAMAGQAKSLRVLDITATREGGSVVISVSDRGPPMAELVRTQIFTPFYSTKPQGMGMGLSICRSAVEFHGGRLEYLPNPEGGAIFRFALRVIEVAAGLPDIPEKEVANS